MKYLISLLLGLGIINSTCAGEDHDPAEVAIGERLFLETRFAQAYYANHNKPDQVLDKTVLVNGKLRSPFAGKTMSCRACHMVDEHADNPAAGMRSYADYATRPPVPRRSDGGITSARNSMSMVNISLSRPHGELFHYDGEFNSMEDLVRGTLTGRNFGWLATESKIALKHLATIIRNDDGKGALAKEFGGSYKKILKASAKDIPEEFRLPEAFRIDVDSASDQAILNAVAKLVSAYVTNLAFVTDDKGNYTNSPYDVFLKKNNLPRQAAKNETTAAYNQRLLTAVNHLKQPVFVNNKDGKFETHKQEFVFAEKELQGMKLFFSKASVNQPGGNCASCHAAPHFSDFSFHNTGLTQHNYDGMHGNEAFNKLSIPSLTQRNKNYNRYLPATSKHPQSSSRFRTIINRDKPGFTDLGLWNVFANPDMPAPQAKIRQLLCSQAKQVGKTQCDDKSLLPLSIAAFKTPVLRDLGHSNPYMHTGQHENLEQVIGFYLAIAEQAKNGKITNADPALKDIRLNAVDIEPIQAFLKALNEDYD